MSSSKRKALAIDLDGTLLVGERLSRRNRDAVRRAGAAGYDIVIATARWRQMAQRIADDIGLANFPVIACNGAQVYCTREGKDIYDTRLPMAFVTRLFDICNANYCIASATLDNHTWLKINQKPAAEYLTEELRWTPELPLNDELPRIATVQGTATIDLVRVLHDEYKDLVNLSDSIGPSGKTAIAITAKGADKGIALEKACHYLGVSMDNVIAFGDAHNDIAMFNKAGQAVAMGQASETVKSAANHVTSSNLQDGVAEFIEKRLL